MWTSHGLPLEKRTSVAAMKNSCGLNKTFIWTRTRSPNFSSLQSPSLNGWRGTCAEPVTRSSLSSASSNRRRLPRRIPAYRSKPSLQTRELEEQREADGKKRRSQPGLFLASHMIGDLGCMWLAGLQTRLIVSSPEEIYDCRA